MINQQFHVALKVIEVTEEGICLCEECATALAEGDRGVIAFSGGSWYAVYQAISCDCCEEDTWVPILCSAATAASVTKQTAERMELNFKEFYLAPLEFQPRTAPN